LGRFIGTFREDGLRSMLRRTDVGVRMLPEAQIRERRAAMDEATATAKAKVTAA
jgi:hypothetical protein